MEEEMVTVTTSSSTIPEEESDTTKSSWFCQSYEEHWSDDNVQLALQIWGLSDDNVDRRHQNALGQLQQRLYDVQEYPLNHPLEVTRCYVDAKYCIESAEQKFRSMMAWRKLHHLDDLVRDDTFHPPTVMQRYYPSCWLEGYDKEGDPIWLDRVGAADPWAVYQRYGHDPFKRYTLWVRESGLRGRFARDYEQQQGRPPIRCTVVFDFDGLCRRHLQVGLIAPLEEGIRILQDYYGSMAKRIIIARAPILFRIVWSVAQVFCNDTLKKSIIFCNHRNTISTLSKYMDLQDLPPCLCPKQGKGRPGIGMPQDLNGGVMAEGNHSEDEDDEAEAKVLLKSQPTYDTEISNCDSLSTTSSNNSMPHHEQMTTAVETFSSSSQPSNAMMRMAAAMLPELPFSCSPTTDDKEPDVAGASSVVLATDASKTAEATNSIKAKTATSISDNNHTKVSVRGKSLLCGYFKEIPIISIEPVITSSSC
jgi:hypothetical protein